MPRLLSCILLQTTNLTRGFWRDSLVPFSESLVNGAIVTMALINPVTGGPTKFYRAVFRPLARSPQFATRRAGGAGQ